MWKLLKPEKYTRIMLLSAQVLSTCTRHEGKHYIVENTVVWSARCIVVALSLVILNFQCTLYLFCIVQHVSWVFLVRNHWFWLRVPASRLRTISSISFRSLQSCILDVVLFSAMVNDLWVPIDEIRQLRRSTRNHQFVPTPRSIVIVQCSA